MVRENLTVLIIRSHKDRIYYKQREKQCYDSIKNLENQLKSSVWTTHLTRNNKVKVSTLTGTPFSYRSGDWGVEIWKSRKRLGVYRTYLSAQINCVMLFLDSPESRNHGSKNVLERLLTEKDQICYGASCSWISLQSIIATKRDLNIEKIAKIFQVSTTLVIEKLKNLKIIYP